MQYIVLTVNMNHSIWWKLHLHEKLNDKPNYFLQANTTESPIHSHGQLFSCFTFQTYNNIEWTQSRHCWLEWHHEWCALQYTFTTLCKTDQIDRNSYMITWKTWWRLGWMSTVYWATRELWAPHITKHAIPQCTHATIGDLANMAESQILVNNGKQWL